MQSKSKWLTVLIVLLTLALVFGPVFVPREISRWYLAAAHNAYRIKDSVLADHYLKRAEEWDPNIKKDGDYWIAQLPSANVQNTDQLLDLIERAVMTDSRWKVRAKQAAQVLSEEFDFPQAVRALKIYSLGQRPTSADDLNQLAYMRSLAGIELDEALKDIDRAIDQAGPVPGLLDTKAWVLHGLKRNLEALGYMNDAIVGFEKEFATARMPIPKPLDPLKDSGSDDANRIQTTSGKPDQQADQGEADQSESDSNEPGTSDLSKFDFLNLDENALPPLTTSQRKVEIEKARRRIGEPGFVLAVLRFHRMRILESLKHFREAAEDRRWIEERGVPVVDELF